jgi:ADP-ribosylglycohydrolase
MPKQLEMLDPPEDDTFGLPEGDEDEAGAESDEEAADAPEAADETAHEEPAPTLPAVAVRPVLEVLPSLRPRADVCAGVVLGGAIGDAMGHPTEFIGSLASIRAKYGAQGVTKFELYWDRGGKHFAPYTDDTQMAEAVLRALLQGRAGSLDLDGTMKLMAEKFVKWSREPQGGHRAPGNACMSGCRALEQGVHWSKAGGATAGGCGSVMRAYPFGLVFAHDLAKAELWAVEHSKLTHRDPIALAASAAMAVGVALLARGAPVQEVTGQMVGAACRYSPPTAAMMATAIGEARSGVGPEVTLDRLRAWAAHEAIASAVYLLERHRDDPRAAILEGANTPGDSDSIATLGGALVGARVGARGLPAEWVKDVERADELMALALEI